MAAVALLAGATNAHASTLRRLVPSITTFASDGTRYVAWQVHPTGPVVVFDTKTGHHGEIKLPEQCQLDDEGGQAREDEWIAAADRFLVRCPGRRGLLDVRSGAVTGLPQLLGDIFPPYTLGPPSVGAFYIENGGERRYPPGGKELGTEQACPLSSAERKRGYYCIELYDIGTAAVTYRSISKLPDLDEPTAPPVCPRFRGRPIKQHETSGALDYDEGVLVGPVHLGEAPRYSHSRVPLSRTPDGVALWQGT